MDFSILIPLLAVFSLFFVPMVGLMVILTTKFALKPLVETLALAMRETGMGGRVGPSIEVEALASEVESLRAEVERLREIGEFDRKLLE